MFVWGANQMPSYRIYFIGSAGRIVGVEELSCADDDAAVRAAEKYAGREVELWEQARRVGLPESIAKRARETQASQMREAATGHSARGLPR